MNGRSKEGLIEKRKREINGVRREEWRKGRERNEWKE